MERAPKITVVMPLLNEAGVIESLVENVRQQLETTGVRWSFVLVNDGSTDRSAEILDDMANRESRIAVVHLSRNFGHQAALHAGLCHTDADAVIAMDSDAQDDPAAIPKMIEHWQQGNQVVYAVRVARKEGVLKRLAFHSFHRLMKAMSSVDVPADAGNFGLMDRVVVDQIRKLDESERYFPGLRTWVGYRQCPVVVPRLERYDDEPRVSLRGLFALAKTALLGFSRVPLMVFYFIAALTSMIGVGAFCLAAAVVAMSGFAAAQFPLTISISCLLGAINALGVAVLGEYIARIYDQVRKRPVFVVAETRNLVPNSSPEIDLRVADPAASEQAVLEQVEQLKQTVAEARAASIEAPQRQKSSK